MYVTSLSSAAVHWERAISNSERSVPWARRKQKSLRVGVARRAT